MTFWLKRKFKILKKKTGCQKEVAMEMPRLIDKDLLYQIIGGRISPPGLNTIK